MKTMDKKPELTRVPISKVVDNPMLVTKHTLHLNKVKALAASVDDIGFFEGIHARKGKGGTFELMFGHHRVAACKASKQTNVHLIVRPYTDLEMIKGFSRENESSKTVDLDHFLEAWLAMEALMESSGSLREISRKQGSTLRDERNMAIAKALGEGEPWLRLNDKEDKDSGTRLTDQANACAASAEIGIRPGKLTLQRVTRANSPLRIAKRYARKLATCLEYGEITKAEYRGLMVALRNEMEMAFGETFINKEGKKEPIGAAELASRVSRSITVLHGELDEILNVALDEEEFDEEAAEEEVDQELEEEYPDSTDDVDQEDDDDFEEDRRNRLALKEYEHAIEHMGRALKRAQDTLANAEAQLVLTQRKAPADKTAKANLRKIRAGLRPLEKRLARIAKVVENGLATSLRVA